MVCLFICTHYANFIVFLDFIVKMMPCKWKLDVDSPWTKCQQSTFAVLDENLILITSCRRLVKETRSQNKNKISAEAISGS